MILVPMLRFLDNIVLSLTQSSSMGLDSALCVEVFKSEDMYLCSLSFAFCKLTILVYNEESRLTLYAFLEVLLKRSDWCFFPAYIHIYLHMYTQYCVALLLFACMNITS